MSNWITRTYKKVTKALHIDKELQYTAEDIKKIYDFEKRLLIIEETQKHILVNKTPRA